MAATTLAALGPPVWGHGRVGRVPRCWVHGYGEGGTGIPGVLPALHPLPGVRLGVTAIPRT